MRRRVRSVSERGFTLPEVMIAMFVMVLAIGVFGASFPACGGTLSRSRHSDLASDACQKQMELYRDAGYASLPLAQGAAGSDETFTAPANLPGGSGRTYFTRVDDGYTSTGSDTGRVRIDVTVSWTGSRTDRGSITLTSLVLK